MSVSQEKIDALRSLAQQQAAELTAREDLAAVAITGSLARGWNQAAGRVWAGSDVDLWAFSYEQIEAFQDGIVETEAGRFYWEVDVVPLDRLQLSLDEESWLQPPGLIGEDPVSLVEALWGCQVVKDETGALYRIQQAVNSRVGDWCWLRRRAGNYLSYGRGVLEGLHFASPLQAIVLAREVATRYGIAAYWMRTGTLLTSVLRIPENLAHNPELQRLYREIYGLQGAESFTDFLARFRLLPAEIQEAAQRDLDLEVLPAAEQGYYDGALRHMRAILADEYGAEQVLPVLGLGEGDLKMHRRRVLRQVEALLALCAA